LLHKLEENLPSVPLSLYHDKRKGELTPSSLYNFPIPLFPEQRSKGMEALQANHERPVSPHEKTLPFSTVHPHGLPCESGAEAPGPTCLKSIARNRGSNGKRNCGNVGFAGRRLPALANYSLNKCSKLFFFFPPLLLASRLLLWRLLLHAVSPRTTDQASTGAQRPMVNASTPKPLPSPIEACRSEQKSE